MWWLQFEGYVCPWCRMWPSGDGVASPETVFISARLLGVTLSCGRFATGSILEQGASGEGPSPNHDNDTCAPLEALHPGKQHHKLRDGTRYVCSHIGRKSVASRAQVLQHVLHTRSEEHTSELQSPCNLVCRLLLEKKKKKIILMLQNTINQKVIVRIF